MEGGAHFVFVFMGGFPFLPISFKLILFVQVLSFAPLSEILEP